MDTSTHSLLTTGWFGLIGLMLIFYVVTDGFDLGVGILSLFRSKEVDRSAMLNSISHVWDANETWLVVVGGALFGAFPKAYATVFEHLYVPNMVLIASLIMRGAAFEFRHAASRKRAWDFIFGLGSLLAAACQGTILGKVITGLLPGVVPTIFVVVTAIGVISGYALLGATYLIKKTSGGVQQSARGIAIFTVFTTVVVALVLTLGTKYYSPIGTSRWDIPHVFHTLIVLGVLAALAFFYILYAIKMGSERGPFRGAVALFVLSFSGLAISLFPYVIPGQLTLTDASSDSPTLAFMLFGIGVVLPIMIGYNLFQYQVFSGKVSSDAHH